MPIVKCSASKATPAKGINYIMDPEKVIAKGHQGFVTQDPKRPFPLTQQKFYFVALMIFAAPLLQSSLI